MFKFLGLKKLIIGAILTSTISTIGCVGFFSNTEDNNVNNVIDNSISEVGVYRGARGKRNYKREHGRSKYKNNCYDDSYEYLNELDYDGIEHQDPCYDDECESDEGQEFFYDEFYYNEDFEEYNDLGRHEDDWVADEECIDCYEEDDAGTYEGMKNKFEDAGIIRFREERYLPEITGYATSYYEAEIDLLNQRGTVTLYRDVWDEEGVEITKRANITISKEDAEKLYSLYIERLENKSKYDEDALEDRRMEVYEEDYTGEIEQKYFYTFEADGVKDTYVFENSENVRFLYNFFNVLKNK